ncbi:hypothetical protein OH738_03045 [Streptomyces hirsutus]|uniref:hypothetical protein n=1 Tax=Streptomyces hirsutus TaxID=35620 RepID=UPI003866E2B8|nr:hypothetical protein OH738_03045 [Streptomyces hirsutus]
MGRRAAGAPILPGAERGVSIDRVPERPAMTEQYVGVGTVDCTTTDVAADPRERAGGRGPDVCADAVGAEARSHGPMHLYDQAEQRLRPQTDRPTAVRQAVHACRTAGPVCVPGVCACAVDEFPLGTVIDNGLTVRGADARAAPRPDAAGVEGRGRDRDVPPGDPRSLARPGPGGVRPVQAQDRRLCAPSSVPNTEMPLAAPDGATRRAVDRPARWRAAPAPHPHGVACPDTLDVSGRSGVGWNVPWPARPVRVTVRWSHTLVLPRRLPYGLGPAVRVRDADGPGKALGPLFASRGSGRLDRRPPLLRPAALTGPYSTLLSYRMGDRERGPAAFPVPDPSGPPEDVPPPLGQELTRRSVRFGPRAAADEPRRTFASPALEEVHTTPATSTVSCAPLRPRPARPASHRTPAPPAHRRRGRTAGERGRRSARPPTVEAGQPHQEGTGRAENRWGDGAPAARHRWKGGAGTRSACRPRP